MDTLSTAILALSFICSSTCTAAPGDRVITVINLCNQTVRAGHTGAQWNAADFTIYPVTGCPESQTRNPADSYCYWDLPPPEGGKSLDLERNDMITFRLTAPEQTRVDPKTGKNVTAKWSGNIWGATGCDKGKRVCETAICFDGNVTNNGYCKTYSGPVGPVTRAEFTLQNERTDFYDVTVIDGVNLPIEMRADVTDITKSAEEAGMVGVASYYWCGNPGGVLASNRNLSDCTWDFALYNISGFGDESTLLTLVEKSSTGNDNCTKDPDCANGNVCGTLEELNDISGGPEPNLFPGKCGKFIGLWNSDGVCTWAAGVSMYIYPNNNPFRCMNQTGQVGADDTFAHLYQCTGSYGTSGYNVDSPTVCGCPTWKNEGINAPATEPCKGNNVVWEQNSLPWVEWMKRACPTSYVFPFDDKSSTFQCQNDNGTQGYTITFCPSNKEIDRIVPQTLITTNGSRKEVEFSVFIVFITLVALLTGVPN